MKNKIIIGAFLLMLASFSVVLMLPADRASVESENRAMTEMPALSRENVFSGEFASSFESFIGDHVGMRSYLTGLSRAITARRGIVSEKGSVISTTKDIGTGTMVKLTLLLVKNTIMEMFRKNPETEKLYTAAVNHYAEKLPENVKLYNMVVPTQLEFWEPMYKNLQDSQSEAISDMYDMINERVKTVNVCDTLKEHSDEYLYFRTDHHWTSLGAYYAYCEFMRTEGGSAVNKDDFEKNEIHNFLGFLYNRVDRPEIAETPDTIEWYEVDRDNDISVVMHNTDENGRLTNYKGVMYDRTKAEYLFFFGSDHPVVEMTNNAKKDGKTIAVVKDSYANIFAPWLIKSYHKVLLIDPRIYKGDFSTILERFDVDEVLIMNYVFTTNFPDYCNMLTSIYK